jgi:ubiquinone/menaquinone biosynthesis C-methylase UbiE
MVLIKRNSRDIGWTYGTIPFARNEAHGKVVEMMEKESRGKVLDVPTGTGILAGAKKDGT